MTEQQRSRAERGLKPPIYLIALSDANDAQRDAVQAIVKTHATAWWHEVPDLWVAQGHTHTYWRDLIKPVLLLSETFVGVFQLPSAVSERMWAFNNMPVERSRWLFENYTGVDVPQPQPLPAPVKPAPSAQPPLAQPSALPPVGAAE